MLHCIVKANIVEEKKYQELVFARNGNGQSFKNFMLKQEYLVGNSTQRLQE